MAKWLTPHASSGWEVRGSSTALYVVSLDKELYSTLSAYHLYGNFGEKFPSNGTGIFFAPKTGTGLSCTIYETPVKFLLSLDLKPGTGNPSKWYRKCRSLR